jgi:hypothetical protein
MNMPSFDKAKGLAVLAGVAVIGYALWKVLETGKGAVQSVSDTVGNLVDSVKSTIGGVRSAIAQSDVAFSNVPGAIGPEGGNSRQQLQVVPAPSTQPQAPESVMVPGTVPHPPESVVPAWMLGHTADNVGVTSGTDDQSAGNAVPQDYSPDAMGLS